MSRIFEKDYKYFKNLKYFIIDCLWYKNHPSHFNLENSLKMIKKFSPKKAILTNLHTDIDYKKIKKYLPKNTEPAYDGLTVNYKICSSFFKILLDIGVVKEANVSAILPSLFIKIL